MVPERRPVIGHRAYALLLRLYPRAHRERFVTEMLQNYGDLGRERLARGEAMVPFVLSIFFETFLAIVRERREMNAPITRRVLRWISITALLLCVPLVLTRVSDEFSWTAEDFVAAGGLLLTAGLAFEGLARRWSASSHRAASALAVLAALLLVWVNLAVGLIGDEGHPANLLYGVVLLVVIAGVVLAGRRPELMARTLFLTAAFQFSIPFIALVIWRPSIEGADASSGLVGLLVLNTFFTAVFALSGWLFRRPISATTAGS